MILGTIIKRAGKKNYYKCYLAQRTNTRNEGRYTIWVVYLFCFILLLVYFRDLFKCLAENNSSVWLKIIHVFGDIHLSVCGKETFRGESCVAVSIRKILTLSLTLRLRMTRMGRAHWGRM